LLIIAFGVAEGIWSDRWSLFQGPEEASAGLAQIPRTIGPWESDEKQNEEQLEPRQIEGGEITGYVMRQYHNRDTGATVQVLLICGRPGPTCVHTPDMCYTGAGYTQKGRAVARQVSQESRQGPAHFWVGEFYKEGPRSETLRIFWAWNASGEWLAPDDPRGTFAPNRFLYKLYAVRSLPRADEPPDQDPTPDFLRVFLPEVQKYLLVNSNPFARRS
jgi:hypothetical protein